ncbi:hypothetical protein [Streptomyces enissocaesilis]|uniref:Uncharacterized protein n=1 Tax=Streptomyces enissocaesilis TaxID=332589 RepID=A0ABN3WVN9_9ACTN
MPWFIRKSTPAPVEPAEPTEPDDDPHWMGRSFIWEPGDLDDNPQD